MTVGPLEARIVRQDCAEANVFPMFDALPSSERTSLPHARTGPSRVVRIDGCDEPAEGFYVYRLRRGGDEHVGVVADVAVEAFVGGQVRGHEEVQRERVDALVQHFESTPARTELVALLHDSGPAVLAAVAAATAGTPVLELTGPEGWEQTVWPVPEREAAALAEELSGAALYVADGHHRVAASVSAWRRAGQPAGASVMCVVYPLDGLTLLAFHRRLVGPVDPEQLMAVLGGELDVVALADPAAATGCFALYVDGGWWDVSYAGDRAPGVAGLDISILDAHVLRPLLGDLAGDASRVEIALALSPLEELTAACDEDGGALFLLRPPALDQLTEVADRGEVMPPKTTYFDPKPFAGIFLR